MKPLLIKGQSSSHSEQTKLTVANISCTLLCGWVEAAVFSTSLYCYPLWWNKFSCNKTRVWTVWHSFLHCCKKLFFAFIWLYQSSKMLMIQLCNILQYCQSSIQISNESVQERGGISPSFRWGKLIKNSGDVLVVTGSQYLPWSEFEEFGLYRALCFLSCYIFL